MDDLEQFKGIRFVSDPALEGQKRARMIKDDDVIRVSPAMFELLKSDRDRVLKNLRVRISKPRKKKV